MIMGPEPMIRTERMDVSFGISCLHVEPEKLTVKDIVTIYPGKWAFHGANQAKINKLLAG